jgi:hypothetical protein
MAKATKTTKTSEEAAMAKNEKHNDGTMSGLKKTMIGTVGTLVTAGGAFLMTYLQKPKEGENKQVQPQSININIPQQQQVPQQKVFKFNQQYQQQPNLGFLPQVQNNYGNPFGPGNMASSIRLLKEKEPNKKVVAVIVSFCSHMSYDQLFTQVQQKTMEGTQVLVYACNSESIKTLIEAFQNVEIPASFKGDEAGKKALEIVAHSK